MERDVYRYELLIDNRDGTTKTIFCATCEDDIDVVAEDYQHQHKVVVLEVRRFN